MTRPDRNVDRAVNQEGHVIQRKIEPDMACEVSWQADVEMLIAKTCMLVAHLAMTPINVSGFARA